MKKKISKGFVFGPQFPVFSFNSQQVYISLPDLGNLSLDEVAGQKNPADGFHAQGRGQSVQAAGFPVPAIDRYVTDKAAKKDSKNLFERKLVN